MINNPDQFAQFSQIVDLKKKSSEINPLRCLFEFIRMSMLSLSQNNVRYDARALHTGVPNLVRLVWGG